MSGVTLPTLPALVVGRVHHTRKVPIRNSFENRSYQWLVDVDHMPKLPIWLRPFASFSDTDHLGFDRSKKGIRADVANLLARNGLQLADSDRIVMLANARVFGHVFDPLTVFWILAPNDELRAVVFEVHNTYGQRHAYVMELDAAGRSRVEKEFYVSPFNDESGCYEIRVRLDPELVSVTVALERDGVRILTAINRGVPQPATSRSLLLVAGKHLFMPQRVSAMIRLNGIRLWRRGLPIQPRQAPCEESEMIAEPRPAGISRRFAKGVRNGPAGRRLARVLSTVAARRAGVDIVRRGDDSQGSSPAADRAADSGRTVRPRIALHGPESFYRRLADGPKFAIGEAYTAGEWSAAPGTDLADALTPFAERLPTLVPGWLMRMRALVDQPIPDQQRGALDEAQANIAAHYDLGNDMFAAFLDPTFSYSSAMFDRSEPLDEQSLEAAQLRKIEAVLDAADVRPGTRLLEIGTGWGALAIVAAQRGADVTTVTLSVEQAALARQRIKAEGLERQIEVRVQDYRDITGEYDAVVSVEMIEAVGERYWPEYFGRLAKLVAPGGAIALQSIVMSHERYLATRHSYGWIQKHIFPGGLIPSAVAIDQQATAAGLRVVGQQDFGADYAETLRRWRKRFMAAWADIGGERFGDDFRRKWEFYFAYCEAGFRSGYLDVAQFRLERKPEPTT